VPKTGSPPSGVLAQAAGHSAAIDDRRKQHPNGCVRRLVAGGLCARGPVVDRLSPTAGAGRSEGDRASGAKEGLWDICLPGVPGEVNRMIAAAINVNPEWFWHGLDV
jgi:hypothetical protein